MEISRDINAIDALTKAAFAPMRYSDDSESEIINRLRKDGDLYLSLASIHDGAFLAHIAFSRVSISKTLDHWFDLSLISVAPSWQKLGIGSALIRKRLKIIKTRGA